MLSLTASVLIMSLGSPSHRCNNCSNHTCVWQNARYKTNWESRNTSLIPDNRKYSLWCMHESNCSCVVLYCLYAYSSICCTQQLHRCPPSKALALVYGHFVWVLEFSGYSGNYMSDTTGYCHYCFIPLVGYIANLPEQLMILCISQNASPITLAMKAQFSSASCCPTCSGLYTL